jgi:diacylglycerol kinase (ATP)
MKAMVIVNPSSGKECAEEYLPMVEELLKNKGYEIEVKMTEKEKDATIFAEESCESRFDVVISMGGDGTLNETINGLSEKEHRPKLGIIPLGTVNDFARALEIPLECEEAVKMLDHNKTRQVDIGKINDFYYMNIVAVGKIAEATFNTSVKQKTLLGPFAYFIEGLKTLTSDSSFEVKIQHDQGIWKGKAFIVLATLTNSVGGFEKIAPGAEVDDGKFRCIVVKDVPIGKLAKIASGIFKGNHIDDDDVDYFSSSKLLISSAQVLTANVDGDEGPNLPIELEVLPRHLEIFIP